MDKISQANCMTVIRSDSKSHIAFPGSEWLSEWWWLLAEVLPLEQLMMLLHAILLADLFLSHPAGTSGPHCSSEHVFFLYISDI